MAASLEIEPVRAEVPATASLIYLNTARLEWPAMVYL